MVNSVIHKSFYIGLLLAGVLIPTTSVFADDSTDFSITVNSSINLRVSSENVGFDITPNKNGVYNSASFNVYSSTNNVSGYSLVMSTDRVNLVSNTINPTTGTNPTIPTLTETTNGISEADFRATTDSTILNHYGVAIGPANFNAMEDSQEIKKTEANNTTEDMTSIGLAAKLDLNTVPGVYSTTINFQMTANPITPSVPFIDPDDDPTKPTVHPCAKLGDLECEDTDEDGTPDALVFPANSLLRTYEIAYTKAGKPMYVEDSNTAIGWRPMTDADLPTIGGKEVRFAMQDISMTLDDNANSDKVCEAAASSTINSTTHESTYVDEALVMDIRDGKSYWIAKLADGKCWMTQNLDLDLAHDTVLTHATTDLGWTTLDTSAEWNPASSANTTRNPVSGGYNGIGDIWNPNLEHNYEPFSVGYDKWNVYTDVYSMENEYSSRALCAQGESISESECDHYKVGNFYSWAAAVATNDSSAANLSVSGTNAPNSICPAGWRLPKKESNTSDFTSLFNTYGITNTNVEAELAILLQRPLYFNRWGEIDNDVYGAFHQNAQYIGTFWSAGIAGQDRAVFAWYTTMGIDERDNYTYGDYVDKVMGFSVRCIAR